MTRPVKAPCVDELQESLQQAPPQEPLSLEARPVKAAKQELEGQSNTAVPGVDELLQQVPPLLPENVVVSNLSVVGFEESWLPPSALYSTTVPGNFTTVLL